MRFRFFVIIVTLLSLAMNAKVVKDTIHTRHGDKIIINYNVSSDGDIVSIQIPRPRIIPSETLRKASKGDLEKLKVVVFDKVGNYGKVKWSGLNPSAFMVPSGMSHDYSEDGFYIFGESVPIVFTTRGVTQKEIRLPLFIAVYEKKQHYKIIESGTQSLNITIGSSTSKKRSSQSGTEVEQIAVHSSEELEEDNDDVTKALTSIRMIRQLLETETELPFSQTIIMELSNLRSIQDRVKDPEVLSKINDVFLEFNNKEHELKEAQKAASLSAQAQEQNLIAQQKAEEEAKMKEAEEKAKLQEEKQQKRTLWMIIGGVILAVLGFVANAVFKYFREIKNQKSIMQMQESLSKQAEHEAGRRTREIVRNKVHKVANDGKNKIRNSIKESNKPNNKTQRKSI